MDDIRHLAGTVGCCALPFLFFGAVIGLFIFLNMSARIPGGFSRRQKMQITASQLGWTYLKSLPYASIPEARSLHLFFHGTNHRVGNVMSGAHNGVQMTLFDHAFQRTLARRIFLETVVTLPKGAVALPWFVLRTTSYLGRLGIKPSDQITFPNHPKFSSLYVLMGKDEAAVRRAFSEAVIEYCETRPGLCLESVGGNLFVFREGILAPAYNVGATLDEATTLLQMFASGSSHSPVTPPPLP
jgi:hypothetical protein